MKKFILLILLGLFVTLINSPPVKAQTFDNDFTTQVEQQILVDLNIDVFVAMNNTACFLPGGLDLKLPIQSLDMYNHYDSPSDLFCNDMFSLTLAMSVTDRYWLKNQRPDMITFPAHYMDMGLTRLDIGENYGLQPYW